MNYNINVKELADEINQHFIQQRQYLAIAEELETVIVNCILEFEHSLSMSIVQRNEAINSVEHIIRTLFEEIREFPDDLKATR